MQSHTPNAYSQAPPSYLLHGAIQLTTPRPFTPPHPNMSPCCQLGPFDGIFFDTYGEYYEDMHDFHQHLPRWVAGSRAPG